MTMGYGYKYGNNNNNSLPKGTINTTAPPRLVHSSSSSSVWTDDRCWTAGQRGHTHNCRWSICHTPLVFLFLFYFCIFSDPLTGFLRLDGVHFTLVFVPPAATTPAPPGRQHTRATSSSPICVGSLSPIIGRPEYNTRKRIEECIQRENLYNPFQLLFLTLCQAKNNNKKRDVVRREELSQQGRLTFGRYSSNQLSGTSQESRFSVIGSKKGEKKGLEVIGRLFRTYEIKKGEEE